MIKQDVGCVKKYCKLLKTSKSLFCSGPGSGMAWQCESGYMILHDLTGLYSTCF